MALARLLSFAVLAVAAIAQTPAPANPFCAYVSERNTVTAELFCVNGVIDNVTAFFGTPNGCPDIAPGPCDDPTFDAYAKTTCLGQSNCTLVSQGDPCGGVVKAVAAIVHCSLPPGGYTPAPPLPPPSCAVSGVPCPPPQFPATWNLTQSTVIQPSSSGFFMPAHPWGLDWSVASSVWYTGNRSNSTCEATSVHGCRILKEAGLATRCFIYHNMELSLEWLESQRAAMSDPARADFFLQYTDGQGHKNGTIYDEGITFGSQFFWDFTNPAAAEFYISSVADSLSDSSVDGTFTDDVTGVPAEHPLVQQRINMTDTQLADLQYSTLATNQILIETLVPLNKYVWQAFGASDGVGGGPSAGSCATWMRAKCMPAMQGAPLTQQFDSANANQSIASFLIARPPYGFIGWGWESDDRQWNDIFYLQPGEPLGLCAEAPAGVFSRAWSNGIAQLDCNSWTATLPFPSL